MQTEAIIRRALLYSALEAEGSNHEEGRKEKKEALIRSRSKIKKHEFVYETCINNICEAMCMRFYFQSLQDVLCGHYREFLFVIVVPIRTK